MKLKLSNILQIVAAFFAILAIVCLFLLGVSATQDLMRVPVTVSISLIGLVFGGGPLKASGSAGGTSVNQSMDYKGGMSIFGLLAFILLVVAIVLAIVAVVMKKSNLLIPAGAVAVVAGICVLLVMVAGTTAEGTAFKDLMEGLKLGIGSILFAVSAILGGGLLVASKVMDTK